MLASGSLMLPASTLPRRDGVPPSEARVAAERLGVVQRDDGWGGTQEGPGSTSSTTTTTTTSRTQHNNNITRQGAAICRSAGQDSGPCLRWCLARLVNSDVGLDNKINVAIWQGQNV